MTADVSLVIGNSQAALSGTTCEQSLSNLEIVHRISEATGTWVLFVRDLANLDKHASKNLVLAAEAHHATAAMSGGDAEAEVLDSKQLQMRYPQLDLDGVLIHREWLQARVHLMDQLADGVGAIPTIALHEIDSIVLIPQRTHVGPRPEVIDASKATVRAGPVSQAAAIAFSIARLLPLSKRIVFDVNSARPVDSAFASLEDQWKSDHPEARLVDITPRIRDSWRHAWQLGRARWVITNELFTSRLPKRDGQRMLVAVSELPIVRSGRDNPDWVLQPTSERRPSRSQVERWDLAVTSSPLATQILRSSSGYVGAVVEGVSLFADAIASAASETGLRDRLGLDAALPLVLCALRTSESQLRVDELAQAFAGRLQFVVVTDDGSRLSAKQVFDDLPSWCAAADLMITDWSSLVMEFAGRQRPILAFQPDALDMVRRRGTNMDLAQILPGPLTAQHSELVERLENWLVHGDDSLPEFAERSSQFAQLGSHATGETATRIWQAVMGAR